ncbi:MAG: dTDP-4-dehydrorhamnose 3,5-epimerase family protein, partial [Bacteroidales bacterium]|nr:dTDP-4-dehydrorhamnose 3,5-epimerase family protein [Bacteroidales bacterium]
MTIERTSISDVVILHPRIFEDARGYFFESFNEKEFASLLYPVHFVQDNESKSCHGVVRGLHYQKGDSAQGKLVRVIKGEVLDIAVDIR